MTKLTALILDEAILRRHGPGDSSKRLGALVRAGQHCFPEARTSRVWKCSDSRPIEIQQRKGAQVLTSTLQTNQLKKLWVLFVLRASYSVPCTVSGSTPTHLGMSRRLRTQGYGRNGRMMSFHIGEISEAEELVKRAWNDLTTFLNAHEAHAYILPKS